MKKLFELGNLERMFDVIFIGTLGLCIGSFLTVLIDRLPHEQGIGGRSYCDHCKKQLQARDLFPVLSYLYNKGSCRYCSKHISWYYPAIEIVTSVVFIAIYFYTFTTFFLLAIYLIIASSLIVIFFADLKYHIIPDEATIALLVCSVMLGVQEGYSLTLLLPHIIAAIALMLTLLSIFFITKKRGMGFGDVKLAFPMGFLLGLEGGFLALYIAFVTGGLVGLVLLLFRKKGLKSMLPFGPFLVIGTVSLLIAKTPITMFFHRLFGFS